MKKIKIFFWILLIVSFLVRYLGDTFYWDLVSDVCLAVAVALRFPKEDRLSSFFSAMSLILFLHNNFYCQGVGFGCAFISFITWREWG